jgi:hypothetical protein
MNFNVESVPHGYLPDYQDNLYSSSPPVPNSEQMKKDLHHQDTRREKSGLNTLSAPGNVFYQSLTQFVEITTDLFQNDY